jgi:hypothetical protein
MQSLTEKVYFSNLSGVFSDVEIGNLLGDPSPAARYGLLKRAIAAGEILRIRRGLYVLAKPYRKKMVSDLALAGKIYRPSYISSYMSLAQHGFIPETVFIITSSCFRRSATFNTPIGRFEYRSTPFKTYVSIERQHDGDEDPYLLASPLRALADMAHHRRERFDLKFLVNSLRIDEKSIKQLQIEEFDRLLCDLSGSKSAAVRFLKNLKAEVFNRSA